MGGGDDLLHKAVLWLLCTHHTTPPSSNDEYIKAFKNVQLEARVLMHDCSLGTEEIEVEVFFKC